MCISFDGGGTKSTAILFDENGPIRSGQSGGTNTNFTTREDCRSNIGACLDQALRGLSDPVIDTLYAVIVGPRAILEEELRLRATVKNIVYFGEGQAGILAGALRVSGLVAMSGTGSDAFYTSPDGRQSVVGAFGSILGDDGSGVWIGQHALRKAIAYSEGWGEPTIFRDLIFEKWNLQRAFDMVRIVHGEAAPFRKVASVVPWVAEAARMGDGVCLSLFEQAGQLMAAQMLALIRREEIAESARLCVCCGGAWKAHPLMYESFSKAMNADAPQIEVKKPLFEHVMAGVVHHALSSRANADEVALQNDLERRYEHYRITW